MENHHGARIRQIQQYRQKHARHAEPIEQQDLGIAVGQCTVQPGLQPGLEQPPEMPTFEQAMRQVPLARLADIVDAANCLPLQQPGVDRSTGLGE
ncbi:hypothetical protein D3C81_1682330 [compost metagenome]